MEERPFLSSLRNPQIRRVRRWLDKPRQCRDDGILLADGIHLVEEAFAAGLPCIELYADGDRLAGGSGHQEGHPERGARAASTADQSPHRLREEADGSPTAGARIRTLVETASAGRTPVHIVTPSLFRAISPVEAPQGVLGVFGRPRTEESRVDEETAYAAFAAFASDTSAMEEGDARTGGTHTPGTAQGHVVVACGVQDPANLGSLLRSARAAGIHELLTTRGTVDPYHHRALRASMGATFHLRVRMDLELDELLRELAGSGRRTIALTAHGGMPLTSLEPRVPSAIVLGSEGSGLPAELESVLDLRVRIPMEDGVESLAVPAAAAVVFFWLYLHGQA